MASTGIRRPEKALSARFVATIAEPGKYFDGHGLFLRVQPNGAKQWVQRIVIRGKRRELGLGNPSLVPLAEARERALENRKVARGGGDPIAEKRRSKAVPTFEEASRRTHIELSPTWKNPKDRAAFISTLDAYTFGRFGSVPVSDVTSADVRQAVLAIRREKPEVARKLVIRVASVFRWAVAEGMRSDNPAVAEALALPKFEQKVKHRKALPYSEVASCIETVRTSGAGLSTKLALEFLVLTAARSGEVRGALWSEFDFHGADSAKDAASATWNVPAERMKAKRPHSVPLPTRALEVLAEAESLSDGSGLVFPGTKHGKALSDMTLSKLVKELGFDADVHGFRTSFRTWAQERTNFPREIAEAALAHGIRDKAEAAYARSNHIEKRRRMMESWSVFLSGPNSNVVQMG